MYKRLVFNVSKSINKFQKRRYVQNCAESDVPCNYWIH